MNQPKRIFVIGHMGAGKSLFSEALANKLEWQYIDANPSLERYIGRSLQEIMGVQGEAAFHRCEGEIISHYKTKDHLVAVLADAVIATEENRKLLSDEYVIYLKVLVPTQMKRMEGNRAPLLPIENMEAFLNEQHRERDHFFEEVANLIIDSTGVEPDVKTVVAALDKMNA